MDDKPKVRRIDFYPGDWLGGTIGMRADEIGVYIQVCALIYDRSGPVHIDQVRAACGLHGNALRRVLTRLREKGKIEGKDSEIFQKRCGNELEKSRKIIERARENGIKGNDIRWNGIATPSLDSDRSSSPSPSPKEEEIKNKGEEKVASRSLDHTSNPSPSGNDRTPLGPDEGVWRLRLGWFRDKPESWDGNWGPNPFDSRCWLRIVPAYLPYAPLLAEFGFR